MKIKIKDITTNRKSILTFIHCKILEKDFNSDMNILNHVKEFLIQEFKLDRYINLELFDIYYKDEHFHLGLCYRC